MRNYHLETYGCEMNKAESAAMEAVLREHGWQKGTEEEADLVLLNTCTVRATAENRAWNRIHQFAVAKKDRPFVLAIVGCMAEQHRDAIKKKVPGVDYVLGTFQKQGFSLMLSAIENGQYLDVLEETPSFVLAKAIMKREHFDRTSLLCMGATIFVPIVLSPMCVAGKSRASSRYSQ